MLTVVREDVEISSYTSMNDVPNRNEKLICKSAFKHLSPGSHAKLTVVK